MSTNPNMQPALKPKLADLLKAHAAELLRGLNCVKVGQIVSFNGTAKTAVVQPLGTKLFPNGTQVVWPVLHDVPVVSIMGGGAALRMPIAAGDQCLIFFADRNIDAWFSTGSSQPPADPRLHDLSDGFALVGVEALTSSLAAYPAGELQLVWGGAIIAEKNGLVSIRNASQNLYTVLNSLITALESLTVTVSGSTGVVSAATISALQAVATNLQGLLY